MSAAAKRNAATLPDLPAHRARPPAAARTRLLHEVLDTLLCPATRAELLRRAGWDPGRDGPADATLAPLEWLDTRLVPKLVDRTGLVAADETRRHLRRLFESADGHPPPEPPAAEDGRRRSTVRRRRRRRSGTLPTVIPRPSGSTILLCAEDPATADALATALGGRAELVVAASLEALRGRLSLLGDGVSLVLLDRRRRPSEELRALLGDELVDHQVIVWGVGSLDTPELQRLLQDADRSIGCSAEAELADVADLCLALLGTA
jgi:hypothetical protein